MNWSPRTVLIAIFMLGLAAVPMIADIIDEPFYTVIFSRMLILSIGAISLNLILGFGGMVSFGHAVYLGIGSYVVGIGTLHAIEDGVSWMANGFIHMGIAVALSALTALIIGAISLRTRGVYFIMITLAFAQMFYFIAVGNDNYGGDDGLSLYTRSEFHELLDLSNDNTLYYINFLFLTVFLYFSHRIINSRFGMLIRGAFVAALLVGFIDTVGRSFLPDILGLFVSNDVADTAAPAISSMLTYVLMALILAIRPQGLFPPKGV